MKKKMVEHKKFIGGLVAFKDVKRAQIISPILRKM